MASRPQTPGKSPPDGAQLAPIPENGVKGSHPPRRSSLGFLRRSKSGEPPITRTPSGNKLSKRKEKQMREQERLRLKREAEAVPKLPPTLPTVPSTPQLQTFGGENARSTNTPTRAAQNYSRGSVDMYSPASPGMAITSSPGSPNRQHDAYTKTESMTHRGRYSYASSAISTINSPRRVRRRKDPTPFNILVLGARNSGKTSFLNFLQSSLALPSTKRGAPAVQAPIPMISTGTGFSSHYLETEIEHERVGITLWDSQGLEKNVVDLQLRETAAFIESKFEDTFTEEMKVVRAPGVQDTHIHCTFLLLDPARLDANLAALAQASEHRGPLTNGKSSPLPLGSLDESLDLQVLRTLQRKTTVIPVISKADTITTAHMAHLKRTVAASLKETGLDPLEALGLDDVEVNSSNSSRLDERDEDDDSDSGSMLLRETTEELSATKPANQGSSANGNGRSSPTTPSTVDETATPTFPLSILSPDMYDPGVIGRRFPWGFADPYNSAHCDFTRLRDAVFTEWRGELREASREIWYEGWRTSRLRVRTSR